MDRNKTFETLSQLIGNTPLLAIRLRYRGVERTVYAKAESYNYTGSIKDRMALGILRRAYQVGSIASGDTIVEATSGNTGISFAALGRLLGHPVVIYMPDWMSSERKALIRSYGAEIRLVTREEGGFLGSIARSEALAAADPHVFLPSQFSSPDNTAAHLTGTGPEIVRQLATLGLAPDAVVAGVGTGGTICGIGACLRGLFPGVKVHPLEPASSPTLSTGYRVGKHRIQGISDEFIPDIVRRERLDEVIAVEDGDAILMAQMLARALGLGVGISSGANLLGALKVQDLIGADKTVVTVFADDSKKYLTTDYAQEEPVREDYLTPGVELLDLSVVR